MPTHFVNKLKHICSIVFWVVLSLLAFRACKENQNPMTPKDEPPVISQFVVPQTVRVGNYAAFTLAATCKRPLDSLTMDYGDGSKETIPGQGKTSYTGNPYHKYMTSGKFTASARAYSRNLPSDAKQGTIDVSPNPAPYFNEPYKSSGFSFYQGDTLTSDLAPIVTDPDGGPLSFEVTSKSADLVARVVKDKLQMFGRTPDMNGNYLVTVKATSSFNVTAQADLRVTINITYLVAGSVHDINKGTFLAVKTPERVIQPPFIGGYVKIDGVSIPFDANGNFATTVRMHTKPAKAEAWITNGRDSSYVRTIPIASFTPDSKGNITADIGVVTNAGTNMTLVLQKAFMYEANFEEGPVWPASFEGKLKGINWKRAKDYVVWISQKDTVMFGIQYQSFTPDEQLEVANGIRQKLFSWLPDSLTPRIYLARKDETLPIDNTGQVADYTILIMNDPIQAAGGLCSIFDRKDANGNPGPDGMIESIWIGVRRKIGASDPPYMSAPFEVGRISVTNDIRNTDLAGKTAWYIIYNQNAATLVNADPNLFYLPILVPIGTYMEDILKMPQ